MKNCSICRREVDPESANILTVVGFGTPRYLCDACDGDFETATRSRDIDAVYSAMDRISKKLAESDTDDARLIETVHGILEEAGERADMIKSGVYDFSSEEEEIEEDEEIPEELKESEEDKELDKIEAEKNKKYEKVTNIIAFITLGAALAFLIYRILRTLF
jgi:hypothetical protein